MAEKLCNDEGHSIWRHGSTSCSPEATSQDDWIFLLSVPGQQLKEAKNQKPGDHVLPAFLATENSLQFLMSLESSQETQLLEYECLRPSTFLDPVYITSLSISALTHLTQLVSSGSYLHILDFRDLASELILQRLPNTAGRYGQIPGNKRPFAVLRHTEALIPTTAFFRLSSGPTNKPDRLQVFP